MATAKQSAAPEKSTTGAPDDGGVLTLLNNKGERIDRADYTRRELAARRARGGRKNSPLNFHAYRVGLRPR